MKFKPSQFVPLEGENNSEIEKALKYLSYLTIPLPEIIMKVSGGHPGITNLSGFNFLNVQQRIAYKLKSGQNPYVKSEKTSSGTKYERKGDSTSTKILKSIAQDVIKRLNGK